jgi:hypothetical protein
MKILNKGNTTKNSFETKPKKHKDFNPVIIHYVGLAFVSLSLIVLAIFNINWSQVKAKIDYETSGWTYKYETKSYPVSQISIKDEADNYTDSQVNAGYALVNYKILHNKGMASVMDMIKQNALNKYAFKVDEINYKKTDLADSLFEYYHSFTDIKYKKGIKEPEAKVYYRLKYHHGKLESKELKSDATLILPE